MAAKRGVLYLPLYRRLSDHGSPIVTEPPAQLDMVVTTDAVSSDGKTGLAWVPDLQTLAAWDEAERKWRAGG